MLDSLIVIGLATVGLGTIHEADGVQERSFWLRNVGTDSVMLRQGYTSCGCTTISFAQGCRLAPGDSTRVDLRFNPRGKGGDFLEQGTIVYGEGRKRVTMGLEGTCISSEESLLRQFPIRLSDSLRLSANRFDLGIMHVGERKERGVVVLHRNEGDRQERIPISFAITPDMPKGLQHVPVTLTIKDLKAIVVLDVVVK